MATIVNSEELNRKTKVLRGTKTSELKKLRDELLSAELPALPIEKQEEPMIERKIPRGKIIAID